MIINLIKDKVSIWICIIYYSQSIFKLPIIEYWTIALGPSSGSLAYSSPTVEPIGEFSGIYMTNLSDSKTGGESFTSSIRMVTGTYKNYKF